MRYYRIGVPQYDAFENTRLINAARAGDLAIVESIVEDDMLMMTARTGEEAFAAACSGAHIQVCEYLMKHGAKVNDPCTVDGQRQSALVTAVQFGDAAFVRKLVAHGAYMWRSYADKTTCALAEAAKMRSIEMVTVLLELGARLDPERTGLELPTLASDVFDWASRQSPPPQVWLVLCMACWLQDTQFIADLCATFEQLQDRELMATHGTSALLLAVYQGNQAIVVDLLSRGASIHRAIDYGVTPIVAAVLVESVEMLQFLIDLGGDVSTTHTRLRNGSEDSLLSTAVYGGALDCALVLLPLEWRPEQRDRALFYAAERDDLELVSLILDDTLPSTMYALQNTLYSTKCPAVLELLLSKCCGADGPYTIAELQDACIGVCGLYRNGHLLDVLVAHGFDVNYENDRDRERHEQGGIKYSMSPLMARILDNADAVTLAVLLDNGIVSVSTTHVGDTPSGFVATWLASNPNATVKPMLEVCMNILKEFYSQWETRLDGATLPPKGILLV